MEKKAKKVIINDIETSLFSRFSKKRIKLLEEKSKLSVYIVGKILSDKNWEPFNLHGEFNEWIRDGDIEEVTNWLRDNYERLNVDGTKSPPLAYNKSN